MDQSTPGVLLKSIASLAFILHIGGGMVGLAAGTVAVVARKGGTLHRRAGVVFVVSMRTHCRPTHLRHLWRTCLGLGLAAGSGFTNGFARLLPGPYHVPTAFFLPQFIPPGLLVYWMIRVRFKGWRKSGLNIRSGENSEVA